MLTVRSRASGFACLVLSEHAHLAQINPANSPFIIHHPHLNKNTPFQECYSVGASGFEPLASRTRTVRSIRAELRPASHDYTTPPHFYKQKFSRLMYNGH